MTESVWYAVVEICSFKNWKIVSDALNDNASIESHN